MLEDGDVENSSMVGLLSAGDRIVVAVDSAASDAEVTVRYDPSDSMFARTTVDFNRE